MTANPRATNLMQDRWSRKKVLALIDSVEEFFEDFYNKSMKKKSIWRKVAEHMQAKGYECSGITCDKKWRNLKNTYIRVLQKQLQGDTSSRFEFFDVLHPILGQELEPADESEISLDQEEPCDDTEATEFRDLMEDDGFLWGLEETHLLLDYILECQEGFAAPDADIGSIWEDIARQMSQIGEEVTSEQCQRKWINLKEGLRVNQTKAEVMGVIPLWEYHKHTQEVVNTVAVQTTVQRQKIRIKSLKELSGTQRNSSPTKTAKKADNGRAILARTEHIESTMRIKQRMEKLEDRIEEVLQQTEPLRTTNVILLQVVAELRRINTTLQQESSMPTVQSFQVQHDEKICSSPKKPEFIIVEAYPE